jgi:hypothetical protein
MRPYEPIDAAWVAQLLFLWGSWLVWPWLAWMGHRLVVRWRASSAPRRAWRLVLVAGALWFVEMRFVEPALIVERTTRLELGFQARIAVISDHHVGLYKSPAFLERVVQRLNAMEVDAVLIAGDHINEPDRPLVELMAPFAKLRHPAFSVPGNHDEQRPGPPIQPQLKEALKAARVVPVEYTHAALERFVVIGLGDRYAGKDGLEPLLHAPADRPRIALVHNPDSAMRFPKGSAALVVSGHTHCGQIRFWRIYHRAIPSSHGFDRGFYDDKAPVPVFVTCGLGEVILPMRFRNPPAIDLLEIR